MSRLSRAGFRAGSDASGRDGRALERRQPRRSAWTGLLLLSACAPLGPSAGFAGSQGCNPAKVDRAPPPASQPWTTQTASPFFKLEAQPPRTALALPPSCATARPTEGRSTAAPRDRPAKPAKGVVQEDPA